MPNSTPPIQRASRICDRKMTTAPVTRMTKARAGHALGGAVLAGEPGPQTRAGRRNADARGGRFSESVRAMIYETMARPVRLTMA